MNSSNRNKSRNDKDLKTAMVNIMNMIIELKKNTLSSGKEGNKPHKGPSVTSKLRNPILLDEMTTQQRKR